MQPNNSQISVQQITDWILAHRTGKAFCDWTRDEIGQTLYQAMLSNEMLVAFGKDESILGVVHGTAFKNEKIFHVSNMLILPNNPDVIGLFLKGMDILWPNYKLEGQRYGKIKHYDTPRFKKHINNRKGFK